jgi:anti-sigma B factor antagonist
MGMKISIKKAPDAVILSIKGKVESYDAIKINKKVEDFSKSQVSRVIIDLSAIEFLDSRWMGAFIYSWKLLKEKNKEMIFCIRPGFIMDLFINANLDRTFTIMDSVEQALAMPAR